MPAKPRSEIFDPNSVGVYHCWNRLVQRRHLFGFDALSGKDYCYRKTWVRNRFRELAAVMAVDVLDFAVLGNHLHLVLRNRPDIVQSWSDDEVARRWWRVCPDRRNRDGSVPEPKPCEIQHLLDDIAQYRSRLSDISWMMRLACQTIGRRANKEDNVDGRFFAKRFDCDRLETVQDLLACSLYVDLNVVHAGIAETPEDSEFTSAYDRIHSRWQRTRNEMQTSVSLPLPEEADAWLAPIFLDERAEAYTGPTGPAESSDVECATETAEQREPLCNPIGSARISNKGFLPMTLECYLSLLDTVGRMVRSDKRGRIPADLPPILERLNVLNVEPRGLLESVWEFFRSKSSRLDRPAFAAPG